MVNGSCKRGCGFVTWHHVMDRYKRFASYYTKVKLKVKVAKWGPPISFFYIKRDVSILHPVLITANKAK